MAAHTESRADEELLTLKEFAHLFEFNLSYLQRKARSGKWRDAHHVAGQWFVLVPVRLTKAARNRTH